MARRRRSRVPALSLFPFLSVLACVIGALTLMIAALAIGQLATETVDVDAFAAVRARVEAGVAERDALTARIAWSEAAQLEERARALTLERDRLRAQVEALSDELAGRSALPTEPRIQLQPSGSGQRLLPRFAECRAGDVRLREPGGWGDPIPVEQLRTSARFHRFLRGAAATRRGTVIFLIRPDGVRSFNAASAVAARLGVRHGKLPLPGQGEIDLSLL